MISQKKGFVFLAAFMSVKCLDGKVIEMPLERVSERPEIMVNDTHKRLLQVNDDADQVLPQDWTYEQKLTQELKEFQVNAFFMSKFYFGEHKQPLYLAVDTGSSWTWTLADMCS